MNCKKEKLYHKDLLFNGARLLVSISIPLRIVHCSSNPSHLQASLDYSGLFTYIPHLNFVLGFKRTGNKYFTEVLMNQSDFETNETMKKLNVII